MKLLTSLVVLLGLSLASLIQKMPTDDIWDELYSRLCKCHRAVLGFAVIMEIYVLQDDTLVKRLALANFPQCRLDPSIFIHSHRLGRVINLQDDICQYWVPDEGVMLLDSVDPLRDILPVMRSVSWSYTRYYMLPLLAQYIIPVVLGQKDLLQRELDVIRSIAPFIGTGFTFFFARLNFAWDCWSLTCPTKVEHLRNRTRYLLIKQMNFKESVVFPSGSLGLAFAAKDENFAYGVLKIAGIWELNVRVIARVMAPYSRLARACSAKPELVTKEPLTCLGLAACITRISPDAIEQLFRAAQGAEICNELAHQ